MEIALPPEIILYISDFLKSNDKYQFAKCNKQIYDLIWKPLDTKRFYQNLFYLQHINLYGTFFSDLPHCWIDFPFSIYLERDKSGRMTLYDHFTIEFFYKNGKLNVKLFKIGYHQHKSITDEHKKFFHKVHEIGYTQYYLGPGRNNLILLFDNDSQIEISKFIGTIEQLGYDKLLDKIHQEVCLLISFLGASFTEVMVHESYGDFPDFKTTIYEKLKHIKTKNFKNYIKQEIVREYQLNANLIDDRKYCFGDFENLSKTIEFKIFQIVMELRKNIGMIDIKKLSNYFEKFYLDLLK